MQQELEQFIRQRHGRLVASLAVLTGDLAAAEDLAQEAFARLVHHWPRVSQMDSPAGWLHHVATNLARSRWRRLRTAQRSAARLIVGEGTEMADVAEVLVLHQHLEKLPRRQLEALLLRHVAGLDADETAAAMGCSAQAVRNLTHRATTSLRTAMAATEPT